MCFTVLENVLKRHHHVLGESVTVEKYASLHFDDSPSIPAKSSINYFEICPDEDINKEVYECICRDPNFLSEYLHQLNMNLEIKSDSLSITSLEPSVAGRLEDSKKAIIELINERYVLKTRIILPKESVEKVELFLYKFKEKYPIWFDISDTFLSAAGSKEVMIKFESDLTVITNQYQQDKREIKLTLQEYEYLLQMHIDHLKKSFDKVTIQANQAIPGLCMYGSVADLEKLEKELGKVKVHGVVEVEVPLSVIQYFQTPNGHLNLKKLLKKWNVAVFYYQNTRLYFLCNPNNLEAARNNANHLSKITSELRIPLCDSFLMALKEDDDLRPMCNSLQSKYNITVNIGEGNIIIIAGFEEDIKSSSEVLRNYIEEKSKLKKSLSLEVGCWRLLNSHMKNLWESFCTQHKSLKIEFDNNYDNQGPSLVLFGDRVLLQSAWEGLQTLLSTTQKRVVSVERPGVRDFFKGKGNYYLRGIESSTKVVIDIEMEDHTLDLAREQQEKPGDVSVKCTASINNVKLFISLGDITEFKADVIVNAANEDLDHVGGVAHAISMKGGPSIQEESTQYVRKKGKLSTGDVWLTKKTGNLPCKALIHAVGPRWINGMQKEEVFLYSVCLKSLEAAKEYHSIVFPAISSGIFGVPIDKCARNMIKALIDFTQKNPALFLQEITFLLLPDHTKESFAFISELKQVLPSDKVHFSTQHLSDNQESFIRSSFSASHESYVNISENEAVSSVDVSIFNKVILKQGSLLNVKVCKDTLKPNHL